MIMERCRAALVTVAILACSALLNTYAELNIGNYDCFNESCADASKRCKSGDPCTWCAGTEVGHFCGYSADKVCQATEQFLCGPTMLGTCNENGRCQGNPVPGQVCGVYKCTKARVEPPGAEP